MQQGSKTLTYFLISSSLFILTIIGCNQIQSTLEQTNNSEPVQTSNQNQIPEVKHELTGKSFQEYYENYTAYYITKAQPEFTNKVLTLPQIVSPCPEEPDGPCSFDLYIVAPENWEESGDQIQTFYLEEQSAAMPAYHGPFQDDLSRIVEEAKQFDLENIITFDIGTEQLFENDIFQLNYPQEWYHTTEHLLGTDSVDMEFFGNTEPFNGNNYFGMAGRDSGTLVLVYIDKTSNRGYFGGLSTPDIETKPQLHFDKSATKRIWNNFGDMDAKIISYIQEIQINGEKKYLHLEVELSGETREQGEEDFEKIVSSIKLK
ncbi:hypothetical protein ACFL21_03005 [Patescibacteria group bacterium]